MKSINRIIQAHGGLDALKNKAIRIEPPSYGLMRLCIEYIGTGPRGKDLLSVAHYFEQNGDLMADPEVTAEVSNEVWMPTSITMHATAYYREVVVLRAGKVLIDRAGLRDIEEFLKLWDRNIREQGYIDAYKGG